MSRAGTGARDQVARLLTLVPLLHARGDLSVAEAAATLGTSPKQVVKDLQVLWMCGLPGGYPDDLIDIDMDSLTEAEGDGTIRVWNADYLARPVRLSPTEATALIVALRTLRDSAAPDARDVVERALSKLEKAAEDGTGNVEVSSSVDTSGTASMLELLGQAVAEGRQVRLAYWVPSRDERTDRVVDPHAIVVSGGVSYLEAHCHDAADQRLFRVDRIIELDVLTDTTTTPAPARSRDLSERLFEPSADAPVVTLVLEPPARWVASYYPVVAAREADGGLHVDIAVQDDQWLTSLLLRLAPHARTGDHEAGRSALTEARRALGHYA